MNHTIELLLFQTGLDTWKTTHNGVFVLSSGSARDALSQFSFQLAPSYAGPGLQCFPLHCGQTAGNSRLVDKFISPVSNGQQTVLCH